MSAPSTTHLIRVLWPVCVLLLAAPAASFLTLGSATHSDAASTEKTRIVLIAGEPSHPSGQHEFLAGEKHL